MNKRNDLENKMKTASDYFRAVPPLDVWARIEAQLEEEKKKPAPLLWVPIALLVLVLTGAIYLAVSNARHQPEENPSPRIQQPAEDKTQAYNEQIEQGSSPQQDFSTDQIADANGQPVAELGLPADDFQAVREAALTHNENQLSTSQISDPSQIDPQSGRNKNESTGVTRPKSEINTATVNNTVTDNNIAADYRMAAAQANKSNRRVADPAKDANQQRQLARTGSEHNSEAGVNAGTVIAADADLHTPSVLETKELEISKDLAYLHPVSVVSLKRTMLFHRKVLQPWRDPIVRCPTFSTRKPIRLFAEVNTGAGYPFRKLAARSDSFSYLERRKASETPQFHWNAGLGIGMVFKDRFVLRTGVDHLAVKEKFSHEKEGVVKVIITTYPDGTRDTSVTTGNELYAGKVTHRLMSIPVEVGYQFRQNYWRLGLMAGVHFNLSYKSTGWLRMPDDEILYREDQRGMFKDQLGLGFSGGLVIERLLGDHLGLYARPDFTYYPRDWAGGRNNISQKYFLPGLRIGVRAYM